MPNRRQRRVAQQIHRELGWLLMNETRDQRLEGVTITAVDVTPDLMLARVHFTVLGDAQAEAEALAGFTHAGGFLRTELAARMQLRFMPQLVFAVDRSAAYGRRIDELLDQIKEADGPADA